MRWRVLAVLVLATTAGCSGFLDADGSTESTVTPAPVPTDVPESGVGSLILPGVSADGSFDDDALSAAHQSALSEGGFAWRIERNQTGYLGNTTGSSMQYRTVTFANASTFYYDTNGRTVRSERRRVFYPEYSEYADGSDVYVRGRPVGQADYQWDRYTATGTRSRFVDPTASAIGWYLNVDRVSISRIDGDGERHYRLSTTDTSARLNETASNYSATAVVTPRGLVRNLTVTYRTSRESANETVRFTHRYTYRLTEVGNVSVPEPDWLSTARERTTGDD